MIKNINIYELRNLVKTEDVLLIDTRENTEYKKSRLKGAINIEVDDIDKILTIYPDKNKKIVVYCSKGVRSIVVAERLDELGYTRIYNLEKGIEKIEKILK